MSTEVLSQVQGSTLHQHSAATTAKLFYVIGGRVMMALNTALINADNVFVYMASMVRVPKATGEAWTPGQAIYYNSTNANFTTTVGSNTLAGIVNEAALSADTQGIIHLSPF